MRLHTGISAFALLALAAATVSSCANHSDEEQNASIVNVEKNVANPYWTPDGETPAVMPEEAVAAEAETAETAPAEETAKPAPASEPKEEIAVEETTE